MEFKETNKSKHGEKKTYWAPQASFPFSFFCPLFISIYWFSSHPDYSYNYKHIPAINVIQPVYQVATRQHNRSIFFLLFFWAKKDVRIQTKTLFQLIQKKEKEEEFRKKSIIQWTLHTLYKMYSFLTEWAFFYQL